MESNKILSADLLDLIFDDRNKDYGAYELRNTYNRRIKKALAITFGLVFLGIGGSVLARTLKPQRDNSIIYRVVEIAALPEEKKPEEIKLPERQPQPEQTRTERFTTPILVEAPSEPPPTTEELRSADIDIRDMDGIDPTDISEPSRDAVDGNRGIIDEKPDPEPDDVYRVVQVQAKFAGNWEKFLLRNLNGNVPIDNDAPAGRYTVEVEFVVDKDGNVSDIKAITNVGYGMEQEAMRVLRKSDRWEPAIQNGYKVKAYRIQRITFEVLGDE